MKLLSHRSVNVLFSFNNIYCPSLHISTWKTTTMFSMDAAQAMEWIHQNGFTSPLVIVI